MTALDRWRSAERFLAPPEGQNGGRSFRAVKDGDHREQKLIDQKPDELVQRA